MERALYLIIQTQNVPVVVVTASPRKCAHCHCSLSEDFLSRHLCPSCGLPQPGSSDEDYFTAFGLPRRFGLNLSQLEKSFYQISRALHPDRFTSAGPEIKDISLKRMSFLNQAYQILKAPHSLRSYLLELEGVSVNQGKATIPAELAEIWFELQEEVMELRESSDSGSKDIQNRVQQKLDHFMGALSQVKVEIETRLNSLESAYNTDPAQGILEEIAQEIQKQTYLNSMAKDVERIRKNVN